MSELTWDRIIHEVHGSDGLAIGHRSDGKFFYVSAPLIADTDWKIEADHRLNTFLECICVPEKPCLAHIELRRYWQEKS